MKKETATAQAVGLPLLLLFAERLETEDIKKQLTVGSQRLTIDMTSWETTEHQDP